MCALSAGKVGISTTLPLDVAFALTGAVVYVAPASGQPSLFALAHTSQQTTLTLLIKPVSNGHSL